jgi:hypothetical protein
VLELVRLKETKRKEEKTAKLYKKRWLTVESKLFSVEIYWTFQPCREHQE